MNNIKVYFMIYFKYSININYYELVKRKRKLRYTYANTREFADRLFIKSLYNDSYRFLF